MIVPTPGTQRPVYLLVLPILIFLFGTQYLRQYSYRDPSSRFFEPSRAYDRIYTTFRTTEADAFVAAHNETSAATFQRASADTPYLCVGMLTLARPSGDIYFRTSMGSLLAGLTQEERDSIYVMPFITHINPSEHPVYGEPWLEKVSDRVLGYNISQHLTEEKLVHIKELEDQRKKSGEPDREKHMSDYTYLMRTCADLGSKYILMLEDDVLALDGWLHRTKAAIKEIERRTKYKGGKDFFYLRLFYTERGFGWNIKPYPLYVLNTFIFFATANFVFFIVLKKAVSLRKNILLLLITFNASLVALTYVFYTAGYNTTHPIHAGVHEMPQGGCCAQGIILPTTKIPLLGAWYDEQHIGFVDSLAERLANEQPEKTGMRWALSPAVIQHVGSKSSKGDNWGSDKPGEMSEAEKLWNFAYELNDPFVLRAEHERASGKMNGIHGVEAEPEKHIPYGMSGVPEEKHPQPEKSRA